MELFAPSSLGKRKGDHPNNQETHFEKRIRDDDSQGDLESLRRELEILKNEKSNWIIREVKLLQEIEDLKSALRNSSENEIKNKEVGAILQLPRDVLLYRIFSYLRTIKDQLRLRQVCKKWKILIEGWITKLDCEFYQGSFGDLALKGLLNCTNLQSLNLSNCRRLTYHSFEYVTQLTSLTDLSIPSNLLGWPPKDKACFQLAKLTNLKSLRLHTNLRDLNDLRHLISLEVLDLSGNNPIDEFKTISSLTNLHTLDISNTRPTVATFRNLEQLTSLRHLYLRDCFGIKLKVLKQLSTLTRLETLYVKLDKDKNIGKKAFLYLGKMVNLVTLGVMARAISIDGIEKLTKLHTLLLGGDGWNLDSVTQVQQLAQLIHLRKLSISCGLLDMNNFQHISRLTNLEDLTLDKPYGTGQKYKGIENLTNLRSLFVEKLFVVEPQLIALTELRSLTICSGYNNNALKLIASHLTQLECLSLENTGNVVDDEVRHLNTLTGLKHLSLASTSISDEGIISLTTLRNLESLDLTGCKLTNMVIPSIVTLTSLRSLKLDGCTSISNVGLIPLDKLPYLEHLSKPGFKL